MQAQVGSEGLTTEASSNKLCQIHQLTIPKYDAKVLSNVPFIAQLTYITEDSSGIENFSYIELCYAASKDV